MRGDGARVFFDLFFEQIEGGLKLGVRSGEGGVGQIVDDDIGIDAVAFNEPDAIGAVDADFAGGGDAVIGLELLPESQISPPQVRMPMTCAHLEPLEALAESFAVGSGVLIAEDDDVAAEGVLHIPAWIADARLPVEPGFAEQIAEEP